MTQTGNYRLIFAMGKIQGTLCMRSHIFIHLATTISLAKPFIFKIKIGKKGLPADLTPALGAGGPGSNPGAPTKNILRVLFYLLKAPFTSNAICGILADRSSQFASRLLSDSSPHDEFAKTSGGRSAIQRLLKDAS